MNSTGDLGRVPALDGLRALAIVLVLLTHTGTPGFETAGAVGVTAFFTLSGYLITSLLLEERACTGRVDIAAFYRRRAWRLLPPLAFVVVAVTAYWAFHPGFVEAHEALGAVTYTTNWFLAYGHQFGGGALTHTWSLAIEEQFYLIWPLLLIACGRLGRRWMLLLLTLAGATSFLWRMILAADGASEFRLYYGSDVRADNLIIGCILAFAMHRYSGGVRGRAIAPFALVTMLVLVFVKALSGIYVYVPTLVALCTAALICAAVSSTETWWLGWRPLAFLGRRSYALYLWHVPVAAALTPLIGTSLTAGWTVAVPLSWLLTLASWRFVEEPLQRFRSQRGLIDRSAVESEAVIDRSTVPAT